MSRRGYCPIASLHASRDLERGGNCDCPHCSRECDCPEASPSLDNVVDVVLGMSSAPTIRRLADDEEKRLGVACELCGHLDEQTINGCDRCAECGPSDEELAHEKAELAEFALPDDPVEAFDEVELELHGGGATGNVEAEAIEPIAFHLYVDDELDGWSWGVDLLDLLGNEADHWPERRLSQDDARERALEFLRGLRERIDLTLAREDATPLRSSDRSEVCGG